MHICMYVCRIDTYVNICTYTHILIDFNFIFFNILFISEKRESMCASMGGGLPDGEVDSPWSRETDMRLDPRTLGS